MAKRQLILEDGTVLIGNGIGSDVESIGELVFHTGMTGYQEVLTDPSFCGQIVTMTYPLMGNYGINRDDFETITPFIKGFIAKEVCEAPSNFRYEETLDHYLKKHNIPGIVGVDTRKLTRIIRQHGTMKAVIQPVTENVNEKVNQLKRCTLPKNQVEETSTVKPYVVPGRGMRVVVVDYGMKHGILRELTKRDCHITVVPYHYSATQIMQLKPDGLMLTNGPGNPKDVPVAIQMIQNILGKIPLFGICLGHQLLSLACGAETEKLTFGHRGSNHPVKDLKTGKTYITSQNHSYAVNNSSLVHTDLDVTHIALNDKTVEGVVHQTYPAFSVQYHPESSPGPEDANDLFEQFLQIMKDFKAKQEGFVYA
ncbi:carbamoyl phosphate synthase small subunit [Oceanobacillus halotolerans]|uniref:carbamoyl phosphate synthase small subunit n=1 Tax=Oceanobacillus halotolerans TaxID=2663380 RepID=UPI0013DAD05F|nr:carbamoyl phosphate synthase small subunit [Oceanobacillus halotolerans]